MRVAKESSRVRRLFCGTELVLVACFLVGSTPADAQAPPQPPCVKGQGFNVAYGNCTSGSVTKNGSFALIDAVPYKTDSRCTGGSCDICQAISWIFSDYNKSNSTGIVVDARGFNAGTPQNCSMNPWAKFVPAHVTPNSVVLLPPGIITLTPSQGTSPTWTVPAFTRVLGQGPNVTVFQAGSGFAGDMIDMGSSGFCPKDCPSVQIEHLGLNATGVNGTGVNGIVNDFSQELSYVNDVTFTNIPGIALDIEPVSSSNSGPYSNLSMSSVGTCVKLKGNPTRGIHGLTCTTSGTSSSCGANTSNAAICIDGINNSIEDVYISGGSLQDGILVGSQAAAQNNLIFNVTGSGLASVVHLSANQTSGVPNVSDVTILGLTRSTGTSTIKDDLIGKSFADAKLGMYVIGEPVQASSAPIGYSRFTTSTNSNAATWLVGPNAPIGTTCSTGSLFSCTGTTTSCTKNGVTGTVWFCAGNAWYKIH
jgi:hypothetical protein